MRTTLFIATGILSLFLLAGCEKDIEEIQLPPTETSENVPEGYFVVSFSPGQDDVTRAAVTGPDGRVRHLRYVIYKSTGEYVKEKVVLQPVNPVPTWPFSAVKDTPPKAH